MGLVGRLDVGVSEGQDQGCLQVFWPRDMKDVVAFHRDTNNQGAKSILGNDEGINFIRLWLISVLEFRKEMGGTQRGLG